MEAFAQNCGLQACPFDKLRAGSEPAEGLTTNGTEPLILSAAEGPQDYIEDRLVTPKRKTIDTFEGKAIEGEAVGVVLVQI